MTAATRVDTLPRGLRVEGPELASGVAERVLTVEALRFLAHLHRRFEPRRRELLLARRARRRALETGADLDFLEETAEIRGGEWQVAPAPPDLVDRRGESTGPADAQMMINALGSGARVFMADLEDSLSPSWGNVVEAQAYLADAVRRSLTFTGETGKRYELAGDLATLVVRPRGWHLPEKHLEVDGEPISASLFDFGLYLFHNARELLQRGSGPYVYLAKLEGHREARLWNEVFLEAQEALGIPAGTVRATVLIETLPAAFEMEEILYELRHHAAGLNAGRWDYIFSLLKTYHSRDFLLPDRAQVGMTVPFMRAYTEALVQACHRHGAHAIGGMAAFIPNRRDPQVTERALEAVRADKAREAADGCDGTWVAHPDLIPVVREVFDRALGERPHQKDRLREELRVEAPDLLSFLGSSPGRPGGIEGGAVTEAGVRLNINVAVQYVDAWLQGRGAVALHNLMEDAATAEISRTQLWQWLRREAILDDGRPLTTDLYRRLAAAELEDLERQALLELGEPRRPDEAARLLERLVLAPELEEFLTLPAYELLD